MSYKGSIIRPLRAMHDTGLLGKYIPEFGRATCFVQHDFYHKYTLDEHTLRAVEFLDELKHTADPKLANFAAVLKEVPDWDVAFLGIFFHDIGKIEGKDHSIKGVRIADEIFKRMQYDSKKSSRIKTLIEHHLIMAHLSQRRDLSEEKVIIDFSRKVQDVENLRMLFLLTYADSRATGEEIWNEWKEALLWELYYRTKRYLEEKVILLPSEIQAMKDVYIETLGKKNIPTATATQHLEMFPVNYLQAYRPETVLEHLRMISEINENDPRVHWDYNEKTNTTELTVCTKDHLGLFAEIAGTISSQDVNILSANIFSRKDGIVLDKFSLENRPEKAILAERIRKKIEQGLLDILQKRKTIQDLLSEKAKQGKPSGSTSHLPIVKFDNEGSLGTTILEIQADDQLGFLYKVTRSLSKIGLNIHLAKISTEKTQIYDVFYITDCDGKKIDHPKVQKVITEEIQNAIESPIEQI
jgi:[protein-PII] uridylyltransferase